MSHFASIFVCGWFGGTVTFDWVTLSTDSVQVFLMKVDSATGRLVWVVSADTVGTTGGYLAFPRLYFFFFFAVAIMSYTYRHYCR